MSDQTLLERITALVDEERRLRAQTEAPEQHTARIEAIAVELDRCWDLLRQRRALREFGDDPERAHLRDAGTVERYEN